MKITYIAPAIKVIKLRTESAMLADSIKVDDNSFVIGSGDGSDASNRNTSNMIWGDED